MKIKRFLLIGLILLGIYVRFADLGQKVYTVDEVRGLLRASGTTSQAFVETVYTGEPMVSGDLQRYQTAQIDRPLGDAMSAFANNPEHPPLYYLLMRFSLQLFHQAVASRWVAVGFSLLLLPAMYWLCQELFEPAAIGSAAVGWSVVSLVAVSPFQVLLAQEARQYSVWAFLAIVSSAFLLRSLKHNTWPQWIAYGVTAALGMYSHLFFTWVLVTHGLYVLLTQKCRLTQRLLRYIVASIGLSVAFFPWVWVVFTHMGKLSQTTKWASTYDTSLLGRAEFWLHNLGIGFIDFNWPVSFSNPFSYVMLAVVAYSTYQLYRHTPKRVWLFVILLMSVSMLAQVVPDVLSGGRRSILSRYLLTSYLGIELAVGYAIAQVFDAQTQDRTLFLKGKQLGAIALILGGIVSSTLISQSLDWGKGSSAVTAKAAPLINQVEQPLILSDTDHTYALSLSHQVSADTRLILINREATPDYRAALAPIPANSDFFVYFASKPMIEFLQSAEGVSLMPQTKEQRSAQLHQAKRR